MSSDGREDPEGSGMPTSKNKERTRKHFPVVTAEITLFLYSLIKFCVTPAAKNLLLTKACYEKFSDMEYCLNTSNTDIGKDDYVQDRIATYNIYGSLGYFLPAGIAAIFVGSWGDKFGRKFPLLIPPFGIVISNIIYVFFALYLKDAPFWLYVVANISSGIAGGELVVISASICYIISVSDAKYRIVRLSILEGVLIIASIIAPLISEALRDHFGNYPTFILNIVLSAVTLVYNFLFLKENSPVNVERKTLKNLINIRHFIDSGKVLIRSRPNNGRRNIFLALSGLCLHFFAGHGARNLLYLFVKDAPLSWTYSEYTTLLAVISGSMAFTMLIALPLMNVFFSFKDTSVAILASVFEMFYYCVLGFATTTKFVYIASSFTIISSLTSTSFRSILSKFVDSDEEGKLFSVMAVIENVGFMVSVAVFNSIWPFTRKIFRGLLFESAGVMALFYIAIATYLHLKLKLVEKPASNCELVSVNSTIKGNSSHHHE